MGNAGNDTLNATGSGRTLLIGGDGADVLTAGATAQAIMIGERTNYDSNMAALDAILNEWASSRNYNQRTNNILTGGGAARRDRVRVDQFYGYRGGRSGHPDRTERRRTGHQLVHPEELDLIRVRSPRGTTRPSPRSDREGSRRPLAGARSIPSGPLPAFLPHGHHRHPCATSAMSEEFPGGTSNDDVDPPRILRALPGARTWLNRATPARRRTGRLASASDTLADASEQRSRSGDPATTARDGPFRAFGGASSLTQCFTRKQVNNHVVTSCSQDSQSTTAVRLGSN